MDNNLLAVLQPITLAHLVIDLAEARDEWAAYPETAPAEPEQQRLLALAEQLAQLGAERARAEGLDFAALLADERDRRAQTDWPAQRNRQTRDNWLSDYA
ncbi:MAG: hypothetical protein FOGNACKC_00387 [Anaerolineae bacterium]|nr:hypothetical protein [Anaerolineae bacterium]